MPTSAAPARRVPQILSLGKHRAKPARPPCKPNKPWSRGRRSGARRAWQPLHARARPAGVLRIRAPRPPSAAPAASWDIDLKRLELNNKSLRRLAGRLAWRTRTLCKPCRSSNGPLASPTLIACRGPAPERLGDRHPPWRACGSSVRTRSPSPPSRDGSTPPPAPDRRSPIARQPLLEACRYYALATTGGAANFLGSGHSFAA
jgi:hypothetical protein